MDNYQIRKELYDAASLYAGFDPADEQSYGSCYDARVYADFIASGKRSRDLAVTLPRTLHDHSISDALYRFLAGYDPFQIVGVMGGHAMKRSDASYRNVALICKKLTEQGKLMVSGGGPGAMEATHFGAWMAGRSDAELDAALEMLRAADTFRDSGWLSTAFRVMERFPQTKFKSLGIPTWLYGHEPSTPFATQIAKYYDNSIREDTILDVPALPTETMPDSATLRFVFNADGKPVAVVLYDPQDEEYSARFHALIDWVAVPREERYLLALAPQGREKAEKVLSGLTSWLLSSFSEG